MDKLQQIIKDLAAIWSGWPASRKVMASASAAAGVMLFAGLLVLANWQTYAPLMTNLTPEDAAQIIDKLQAAHVPYKLSQGGTAVLVPEAVVHEQRLHLAGEGLPRGGNVGFEIFDEPNFGMSHFSEQLNYRRALEGELRRTIRQIEAVRDARVHIVVPESSLFKDQEAHATASVTLQLHSGRRLGQGQVQAIVHLVAASVTSLTPDNVTVVDSSGSILAKGGESPGNMGVVLERQRAVEHSIEERVQQILTPLVGEGHVVVRASASLDFAKKDRTTETYDPQTTAVRSEQFSEEHKSPANTPSGIPGSRTNLTGVAKGPEQSTESGRKLQTRNFEINRVVEHEIGAEGRLARLSVAVLLDGISVTGADGKVHVQERSPEEIGRITDLVRRAVGFDADRDDQVIVQSMAFGTPVAEAVEALPPAWLGYVSRFWLPTLTTLATALVLLFILRSGTGQTHPNQVLGTPRSVRELEGMLHSPMLAAGMGPAGALGTGAGPMAQLTGGEGHARSIRPEMIRPEPERAAEVLKNWLSEA
jgi:flagellar M-ring protein FliF